MCSFKKLNILVGSLYLGALFKIVTALLQWTDIRYVFSLHDSEYYNVKMVSLIEISCKVIKIIFVNFSLNYLY